MNNLKYLRNRLNLSQENLATELKVSQQAVAKWETGEAMPRADKLPELAKVLQCDIAYKNTKGYQGKFDYCKFYEWALSNKNCIFISEYSMPKGFVEIYYIDKTCSLGSNNNKQTVERLFVNRTM